MNQRRLPVVAIALILTTAGAACRAEAPSMSASELPQNSAAPGRVLSTEEVFGLWALTPVLGPGTCRLTLNRIAAGDLYGVLVGRCDLKEPMGASGWRPTAGGFELIRAGQAPLRFRQTGVDDFETLDGQYRLRRAPTA